MQEYGVKESWSKSFTFSINVKNTREFGLSWTQNRPVARLIRSFKNNNNVLLQVDTSLILYDSEKKRIRQLKIGGNEEWTDAEVYVPSLFSLNSLANSEAQRPNKRQRFNSGARFIWQRPNKRESLRGCRVENYRAKLEEICQGRLDDDPVLAV
ncbi:hypothetical protein MKW92_043016 [Papaver armeniacum]|nr:hypothetical protein MKW92_043016 [Papaver armeniacum]